MKPKKVLFTTKTRRGMLLILLLIACGTALLYLCKPIIALLPELNIPCLLHLLGYNCPFCGGTHCVRALLDFDILTAVYYNPAVVAAAVLLCLYLLYCLALCLRREYSAPAIRLGSVGVYTILAIVLIFFIIRNMPFYKAIFY